MATLTEQVISRPGASLGLVAATGGGDDFVNTGQQFLVIRNDDASTKTVTVVTSQTVDGLAVADLSVAVPAGNIVVVGTFFVSVYGTSVSLTYSDVTSLTIGVLRT